MRGLGDSWDQYFGVDTSTDYDPGTLSTWPGTGGPTGNVGFNWQGLLTTGFNDAAKILGTRYAVPQLNAGQYIQSGPNGTVMYQQQPGSTGFPGGLTSGSGSSMGMLLIAGIGLVALFAFSKGK
jgi:hypothetical protein